MASRTPLPLNPQPVQEVQLVDRGHWGYFRKKNGWIYMAQLTPANRGHQEFKGSQFLERYGRFPLGTRDPNTRPAAQDDNRAPWNPALEPWRLIFQRGGAHEFPVDQIIALQWHLSPPYEGITFPQLDDVQITDIECPECDRTFSGTSVGVAVQNLKIHLTTRMDARHSYTVSDLVDLGAELGVDMQTARTKVKPVKAKIEGAEQVARARGEYDCTVDGCDWHPKRGSKRPEAGLRMHLRSAHDIK